MQALHCPSPLQRSPLQRRAAPKLDSASLREERNVWLRSQGCQWAWLIVRARRQFVKDKQSAVTCQTGLLSRVTKHPVCPPPHLRCCGILGEPVPIVFLAFCRDTPMLTLWGWLLYREESASLSLRCQFRPYVDHDVAPICADRSSSSLDAQAEAEACRQRTVGTHSTSVVLWKQAASCSLPEYSTLLRARPAAVICLIENRIASVVLA